MRMLALTGSAVVLSCLVFQSAHGQVSRSITPQSIAKALPASIPIERMDAIDVDALLAEDSMEQTKGIPFRFGFPFEVSYTLENSGVWEELSDGARVWRLRIEAPGAHSINLIYRKFWVPEGATLHLYTPDRNMTLGAFTSANNKDHGQFATSLLKGDVTILEYYEPADVQGWGTIEIERVVHGYRNLFDRHSLKDVSDFGESGSCNNNVNCPEGAPWQDEIRSVALITTSGGFRLCSGAMVNNIRQDGTPYFLTANHCLGGEATWVFIFNYESPSCANVDGPTFMSVSGSTLRAANAFSDFALLELSEQPPDSYNVYLAGWNANDVPASASVGIHHPSGDIKKISFDDHPPTSTSYLQNTAGDNSHWRIIQWDDGTTEPGSSGSPIFDQNHRITGQLHGGFASCASLTSDWYGKVSKSWTTGSSAATRLKDWLDPDNTGALVLDGRDLAGVTITHTPLQNTPDTLNDYVVVCDITSPNALLPDSLLLYYRVNLGGWVLDTLVSSGNPDEYTAPIANQPAGSTIEYYLFARDIAGDFATTDTFQFAVLDYAVTLVPSADTGLGAALDTVWYELLLTNAGAFSDSYTLLVVGAVWNSALYDTSHSTPISSSPTIGTGASFPFSVRVIIPATTFGELDDITVIAQSTGSVSTADTTALRTISEGAPFTIPFIDEFTAAGINTASWVQVSGATVDTFGVAEPTPIYSLRLNGNPAGADTIVTQAIDLSVESSVALRFFYERKGGGESPDNNDDLVFSYRDTLGVWKELRRLAGSGPDMTTYDSVFLWLPADAYGGSFRLRIHATGNVGANDDWFVDDVRIESVLAPDIMVAPGSISHTLPSGDSTSDNLIVSNMGPGTLAYSLSVIPSPNKMNDRFKTLEFMRRAAVASPELPEGFVIEEEPKGSRSQYRGRPVDKDAGGPDAFGYYWIDSDEPGGPVFAWTDISTTGTDITTGLADDNFVGPFAIGFTFPYYGTNQNQLYVSSNGLIGFASDNIGSRFKTTLPTAATPNNILAWLWDDLNPVDANNPGAKVYLQTIGDRCIIQFKNYPEYQAAAGDVVNAQVILESDGSITFQYQSIAPGFDILNCAVGIENGTGSDGLQVAYLQSYLKNNLAVRFYQPYQWLTLSNLGGTLAPGESDTIVAWSNASGLDSGTYNSTIVVTSNDPDQNENPLLLPASLTISSSSFVCGDANGNGAGPTVTDLTYLVNYLFNAGPPPPIPDAANVNGTGGITVADLTYLVNYLFNGGPAPNCP